MYRNGEKNGWGIFLFGFAAIMTFMFLAAGFVAQSKAGVLAKRGQSNGIQLVMFEQEGCHYCEVWDENVGVSYHKTPEGRFAPLKKVDIHMDDDLANVKPVIFTPTFVLLKDGREVGRLTGYISEDFFWGLLAPLLKKHGYDDKVRESKASGL